MYTSSTLRRAMYKNTRHKTGRVFCSLLEDEGINNKKEEIHKKVSVKQWSCHFLETHEQITGNEATCIFLHKTEAANLQESYCINTLGRPSISGFESETKCYFTIINEHHYRSTSTFSVLFENKTRMKVQVVSQ